MRKFDFSGWATKANLKCADGVTIMKDAFKDCDGVQVPLVWNHGHKNVRDILGHAILENRPEGVYAYCTFNDTPDGRHGKALVQNGDIDALSIWANSLKRVGTNIVHGVIRELSLVMAGANPGAKIDLVLKHSAETDEDFEEGSIYMNIGGFELSHSEYTEEIEHSEDPDDIIEDEDLEALIHCLTEPQRVKFHAKLAEALEPNKSEGEEIIKHAEDDPDETLEDIFNTLTPKQKTVVYAMIGDALAHANVNDNPEGGELNMNVFENHKKTVDEDIISHSAKQEILAMMKRPNIGSLKRAIQEYAANHADELKHDGMSTDDAIAHGIDEIEKLFPDFQDVRPGAPELITRDQGWVSVVIGGVQKSPISRIRTRQTDIRPKGIRAKGYTTKGEQKTLSENAKLLARTTEPTTVYRKDELHRDDIIDITEFDVVDYNFRIMKLNLNEEIAQAALIGDGREDLDPDKIDETKIRPIYKDNALYTIHQKVDIAAARAELQGSDTSKYFGDNFVISEAIITAALYAKEKYKGSGKLDFFCTPHLVNVMMLAKDMNGRRIYNSRAEIAARLDVNNIYTVEQMEGITNEVEGVENELLGIMVDLRDYQFGATKGGEITRFNQFDIDVNKEKYLLETRLSGALTRVYSAIVLEQPVADPVNP